MKTLTAVDLFCGAGGTSTGLARACDSSGLKLSLLAINHWPVAIETHGFNHPATEHLCARVDQVDPHRVVRGRLDLLMASPECTHFSNSRGGMPMQDQSRASAWEVVRWATALRPSWVLVENVREFLTWGPLGKDGRPLKTKRGETFIAWVQALRSLNYT
ncbi:MAG: DNA cytosine methyltransferase, partial [Arthrobacter sp.]|nr:DNA cytosine methyltransferase [Arthrobacter sp.]